MHATVTSIHPHLRYFFVRDINAKRVAANSHVFVDRRAYRFDMSSLRRHDVVEIGRLEQTPHGWRGLDVTFVGSPTREPFIGHVVDVHGARGFVFVEATEGDQLICMASDFLEKTTFDSLKEGTWVSGERINTPRGCLGIQMALTRPECIPAGSHVRPAPSTRRPSKRW